MSRRNPRACLSDGPVRLEDRNGEFGQSGQVKETSEDSAPLSEIRRLWRVRPTGFEPVTFGFRN